MVRSKLEFQPLLLAHEAVLFPIVRELLSHAAQKIAIEKIIENDVRKRLVRLIRLRPQHARSMALLSIEAPVSPQVF
ncbi:hypothetical protein SC1_02368 [Sphingopyxis sp. C-1]|nr:hypothetical protein SC1_02368 [Sphingopyxis sp. C-1]